MLCGRNRGGSGKRSRRTSASSSGSDFSGDMPAKPESKKRCGNDGGGDDDDDDDEDSDDGNADRYNLFDNDQDGGDEDDISSLSSKSESTIYEPKRSSSSAPMPPRVTHKADLPSGTPTPSLKASKKQLAEACDDNYDANQENRDRFMKQQKSWEGFTKKTTSVIERKDKELTRLNKSNNALKNRTNTLIARVAAANLKTKNAESRARMIKQELQQSKGEVKTMKSKVNDLQKDLTRVNNELSRAKAAGSNAKPTKSDEIYAKAQAAIDVAVAKAEIDKTKKEHDIVQKQQAANIKNQKFLYNTAASGYQGVGGGGVVTDMRQLVVPRQMQQQAQQPMMNPMMSSMTPYAPSIMQQQMMTQALAPERGVLQGVNQGMILQVNPFGQGVPSQGVHHGMMNQVTPQAAAAPGHGFQVFTDSGRTGGFVVPGSITLQSPCDNVSRMATPVDFGISNSTPRAPVRHPNQPTENDHPNESSDNLGSAQGKNDYSNPLFALANAANHVGEL